MGCQESFATKFSKLNEDNGFEEFRCKRYVLVWPTQNQVDLTATTFVRAQVTEESFNYKMSKVLSDGITQTLEYPTKNLIRKELDETSFSSVNFADSSFANFFKRWDAVRLYCTTNGRLEIPAGYILAHRSISAPSA